MSRDQFAIRRTARGYTSPWQRPGCHNCQHVQHVQPAGSGCYCSVGHFYVNPFGTCPQYQLAQGRGLGVDAKDKQ